MIKMRRIHKYILIGGGGGEGNEWGLFQMCRNGFSKINLKIESEIITGKTRHYICAYTSIILWHKKTLHFVNLLKLISNIILTIALNIFSALVPLCR